MVASGQDAGSPVESLSVKLQLLAFTCDLRKRDEATLKSFSTPIARSFANNLALI